MESNSATFTPLMVVTICCPFNVTSKVFHSPALAGLAAALAKV